LMHVWWWMCCSFGESLAREMHAFSKNIGPGVTYSSCRHCCRSIRDWRNCSQLIASFCSLDMSGTYLCTLSKHQCWVCTWDSHLPDCQVTSPQRLSSCSCRWSSFWLEMETHRCRCQKWDFNSNFNFHSKLNYMGFINGEVNLVEALVATAGDS
jgi:hypothetical protein